MTPISEHHAQTRFPAGSHRVAQPQPQHDYQCNPGNGISMNRASVDAHDKPACIPEACCLDEMLCTILIQTQGSWELFQCAGDLNAQASEHKAEV